MPLVQITVIQGRATEDVKHCIKSIARTIHETLGAPMDTIRVIVQQVPAEFWAVGDRTRDEIDAERPAAKVPASEK